MQSNDNNNDKKIFIVGSDWVRMWGNSQFFELLLKDERSYNVGLSVMDGETASRARVVTMIGKLVIKNVWK